MNEPTEQFLLRLPADLIRRLEEAARRFNRRSRNQVAAEVLEQCLPIWEQAEGAKLSVLEQHRSLGRRLAGDTSPVSYDPTQTRATDGATPIDMSIHEPVIVPVIGGRRATDKRRAAPETSTAANSAPSSPRRPTQRATNRKGKK